MSESRRTLVDLLALERIDRSLYRHHNPEVGERRLFGGQVAAQALQAAANTVEADHAVNSLHAYFLRPGRYGVPIVFTVDRIRDGSSFTTRRVVATQDREAILNLDASFHAVEDGGDYEPPSPLGSVPDPDGLGGDKQRWGSHHQLLDARPVEVPGEDPAVGTRWIRIADTLGDDPVAHACGIAFFSDTGPLGTSRRAIGGPEGTASRESMMTASLDHCVWFHRPARADEWLYYRIEPVACGGARGLARGGIWSRDGHLVASVAQEGLLRWRHD